MQEVFEKTSDREKLCSYWLEIPDDKCGDAATAANYFVNHDTGYRRWRWIIWFLDSIGDTALADSLMDRAEPHAGVWIVFMPLLLLVTTIVSACIIL